MLSRKHTFECQCNVCKKACVYCPGWFLPGEAEKAAEYLDIPLQDFFDNYLGVNWWGGSKPIFVLAPALTGKETGMEYPEDPRGQCIFYKDELCSIHLVKPYECAMLVCGAPYAPERHFSVADAWKGHQEQISNLLGHEPKTR